MNYRRGPKGKIDWTFIGVWFFILITLALFWLGIVAGTFAIMEKFGAI